jgi:hypothetical protein
VDFALSDEDRMLKDLVGRFVREELLPLERIVLEREAVGQGTSLTGEERAPIDRKARELGLWALDAPEEFGGANLPFVSLVGVYEELAKTVVPMLLGPDSPNLRMLMITVSDQQREKYLKPYSRGETLCAMAISEPGAGGDPCRPGEGEAGCRSRSAGPASQCLGSLHAAARLGWHCAGCAGPAGEDRPLSRAGAGLAGRGARARGSGRCAGG